MSKICNLLFLYLSFTYCLAAQDKIMSPIIEDLNTVKPSQGKVKVMQDESIKNIVAIYAPTDTTATDWNAVNHIKVNGFKIQVFSGNNNRQSKDEAQRKAQMVKGAFPSEEVTVSYNSPFWRVRVGNYVTREQANEVLVKMKKTFPSFGREMYVIENVPVKLIVD